MAHVSREGPMIYWTC